MPKHSEEAAFLPSAISRMTGESRSFSDAEISEHSGSVSELTKVPFPVVGLGASAGGLEAFKNFFQAMPADSNMAFVLVQHLDPTHESMMTDLLTKYTAMRVMQIEDDMALASNTLFMIPPNKYLFIQDGRLKLTEPIVRRGMRMPIDFLFRSMAESLQERAICIVLSGTGADGALGVRAVKGEGGTVFVQEPRTAQYDGMPKSAIATGVVDFVLPVEDMPRALLGYVRHALDWPVHETQEPPQAKPDDLQSILALLHARTHHDFRCYKQGTLSRRIHRRMGLRQTDGFPAYLALLREDAAEVKALLRDLLIGVTSFFRDPEAWQDLETQVLRRLLAHKEPDDHCRVWVPGCSSGEEAYSLAMLIAEVQHHLGRSCVVQIFASDIDEAALEVARNGVYPENIAADVTSERLRRFFESEAGQYRVSKVIRDRVVFAAQNLVRDPPFSKLDLISCRNLLIYLDNTIQKRVINLLHFALREGGYLFLGPSESLAQQTDLFEPVAKKSRLYKRIGAVQHPALDFPFMAGDDEPPRAWGYGLPREPRPGSITALAHEVLLREYVPAVALVNRRGEAIYYHGPIACYLEIAPGEPTRDIAELAKEGLGLKVRSVLQRALREKETVRLTGRRRNEPAAPPVVIVARPLDMPGVAEGLLLLTFEDEQTPTPVSSPPSDEQASNELRQMEYELSSTREDLQSTIEELETSNEELKASNEEVMSMNEELQSTNEELETSKEELQSLNEELSTVNNQLQDKMQDMEQSNNDIVNLLNSTNVATLFLDRMLQVRRFTPGVTRLFRLIPADVGRHLEDIALRFDSDGLMDQVRQVLSNLQPSERTVQADEGSHFLSRILPYRTGDDRIDGVVLTFTDITTLKQTEESLRHALELNQSYLDTVQTLMVALDRDGCITMINHAGLQLLGYQDAELLGKNWFSVCLAPPEAMDRVYPAFQQLLEGHLEGATYFENAVCLRDGGTRLIAWHNAPLKDAQGAIVGVLASGQDITQQRQAVGMVLDITERKRSENELMASNLLAEAQKIAHMGSFEYIAATQTTVWSEEEYRLYGLDPTGPSPTYEEMLEKCIHPDDKERLHEVFTQAMRNQGKYELEHRIVRPEGDVRWVYDRAHPYFDDQGKLLRYVGMTLDITERKRAEVGLRKLSVAVEQSPVIVMITDAQARIEYVNPQFSAVTGYGREEAMGKNPRFLQSGQTHPETYRQLWDTLTAGQIWAGELQNRRKDGRLYWEETRISPIMDETGQITHYVGIKFDITDQKEHQEHLAHLAHYDVLTNLPNRLLLADRLHQHMAQSLRHRQRLAVAFLDLDGFKSINDTYGHDTGDAVLVAIGRKLRLVTRDADTIARLGGDEFALVLPELSRTEECVPLLERVLNAMSSSIHIGGQELTVTASLGVTFYPQAEDVDGDQLLRQADQAMYQAKLAGKNRYHLFDAEQDRSLRGHHESIESVQQALTHGELELHYQPKVNLRTGHVIGVEALIRWRHPQRGLLNPSAFLPAIEGHPLAVQVGNWVICQALADAAAWQASGLTLPISVNVFAYQLLAPDFVEHLNQFLTDHPGVRPEQLELEILESAALRDLAQVSGVMEKCRALGIRFALDDFGTGYSSLNYLKHLPAETLKIDQSFVHDMLEDHDDLAIVEGILGLAKAFRRQVVAEGVEATPQGILLLQLGCTLAQGYGIAHPMPASDLPGWVSAWRVDPAWAQQHPIPYERIPVLYAAVEHRAWVHQVECFVRGQNATPPTLDRHECRFSEWLEAEVSMQPSGHLLLAELEELHKAVHIQAQQVLARHAEQASDAVEAGLAELHRVKDRLLGALERIIN